MKKIIFKAIPLFMAFILAVPNAFAARYYLTDNDNLVKGCSDTIEIKIDTEGADIMAGDSKIIIDPNEATINQVSIGSPLPMQMFNQFTANDIKLSGARLPTSGTFSGVGTFGYINFTPGNASRGTFEFSPDLNIDNTLVDENINNVLTQAVTNTYTFKDRYNVEVDGVGFCSPDTTPPTVQFITPPARSSNNPLNTNIIFTLSDDRAGVDEARVDYSLEVSPDDRVYSAKSYAEDFADFDGDFYRVALNPNEDFAEGETAKLVVSTCDKNTPANCVTRTTTYRMYEPFPPPAVCGNSIVEPHNGEQCDDGNTVSDDGCTAFCLLEAPPLAAPACDDGIHNQGEDRIDCGGPCLPCSSCVDRVLNQGEIGVDCGGPCPPCGEQAYCEQATTDTSEPEECVEPEYELITICHYFEDEEELPISLVIRDIDKDSDEFKEDSLGPCSPDELLIPVAPEIEEKAIEEAEVVHEEEEVTEEIGAAIVSPETQAEVLSQIDLCKANPDYAGADFDDYSSDVDEDGITDRMECYAETNPLNPDTDGDGCTDSDEFNQFGTNPNDATDCSIPSEEEEGFMQVIIRDPKPGWTLAKAIAPRFSGIAPLGTDAITITAFHADQKIIKALGEKVNILLLKSEVEEVLSALDDLKEPLQLGREFIELNSAEYNYVDFDYLIADLESKIKTLREEIEGAGSFVWEDKQKNFGEISSKLSLLFKGPIKIGSTGQLSPTVLGDQDAKSFELVSKQVLDDQKFYDVVATATFADTTTVNSSMIRFGVNTGFTTRAPIPKTLGGKLIPGRISFNGTFIGKALAQGENGRLEMEVDEERPIVTGDTEFGSQVFAIWNSVVLTSSVISDSEQGAFEIQAPRDLDRGMHHRVTLYAVKTEGEKSLRSDSVDVYFKIKTPTSTAVPIAAAATGGSVLLIVIGFLIRRSLQIRSVAKILKS